VHSNQALWINVILFPRQVYLANIRARVQKHEVLAWRSLICVRFTDRRQETDKWPTPCNVPTTWQITLLTYSMVQSPSLEANRFVASQEVPRISRKTKVHHRTHKRPPTLSILGQPNPVHIPTSHLLEIHSYIIHPSTPRSPQWSISFQFPTKTLTTADE